GLLLPAAERRECDVVMMPRHRLRPVQHPHAALHEAIRDLDVLPGRVRETRIEEPGLDQQRPRQRNVRRIEEVERDGLWIPDQAETELQAILVDVVENRRDLPPSGPGRVAEDRDRERPRFSVSVGMNREQPPLRYRVVAEKEDPVSLRLADAPIAG